MIDSCGTGGIDGSAAQRLCQRNVTEFFKIANSLEKTDGAAGNGAVRGIGFAILDDDIHACDGEAAPDIEAQRAGKGKDKEQEDIDDSCLRP